MRRLFLRRPPSGVITPPGPPAAPVNYAWGTRTLTTGFDGRDGAQLETFLGKWWLVGGWNPYDVAFPGAITTNEIWSSPENSPDELVVWTQELAYDPSPPTSGAGARWKKRHCFGLIPHTYGGIHYLYVLGGDFASSTDPDFTGPNSAGYQGDVWRTSDGPTWERVATSESTPFTGRFVVVFGSSPGKLWAFGGQNGALGESAPNCRLHNDLMCSTDGGATWTTVLADAAASSTRPGPRGMINRMPYWRGRMWLVGGGTTETAAVADRIYPREVWSFDPDNAAAGFTRHTNPPWIGVDYTHAQVFQDELWILGGYSGVGYGGGDLGHNTDWVWSSSDGERWTRHANLPGLKSHADGIAVSSDGLTLGRVAGNGALVNDPTTCPAYALVATPLETLATVPARYAKWRAADATISSGVNIATIPDSTGNGHHLVPTSAGDATLNATDADGGGAPSAESDGSGGFLHTVDAVDLTRFTLMVAAKYDASAGSFYHCYALNGGNYMLVYASDGPQIHRRGYEFSVHRSGVTLDGGPPGVLDQDDIVHVYTYVYDGTAAGSFMRIDGAVSVPDEGYPLTGNPGTAAFVANLYLLSDSSNTLGKAGKWFGGDLWNSVLTTEQIEAAEAELRAAFPYKVPT